MMKYLKVVVGLGITQIGFYVQLFAWFATDWVRPIGVSIGVAMMLTGLIVSFGWRRPGCVHRIFVGFPRELLEVLWMAPVFAIPRYLVGFALGLITAAWIVDLRVAGNPFTTLLLCAIVLCLVWLWQCVWVHWFLPDALYSMIWGAGLATLLRDWSVLAIFVLAAVLIITLGGYLNNRRLAKTHRL